MKYLLFLLPFICTNLQAQSGLEFKYRTVESENKWVAIGTDKDTVLKLGFIYIDASAGLTLHYEGSFAISKDGKFTLKKTEDTMIKYRLEPNNAKVAFIPATKYNELGITAYPDWLKTYTGDTSSVEHLYRWGYLYNGYNECEKALGYLERAQKINPQFKGLEVELAFSYNCLGRYDKAISILKNALAANPADAYINKELIYAQIKSGQLDQAAESCKKAISVCTDKTYHGENCYNLLHQFFVKRDEKNFMLWVDETKKWNLANANLMRDIKLMEKEFAK